MNPEDRAAELALWSSQLDDLDRKLSHADSVFHLFRLLVSDPPGPEETLTTYLAMRGGYPDVPSEPLEKNLFALFTPTPPSEQAATVLAAKLSEPVESGHLFECLAATYYRAYGQEAHERILRIVSPLSVEATAIHLACAAGIVNKPRYYLRADNA
jgi:hypothetical protein